MKKFKKLISVGLSLALLFSSVGTASAYQLNGTEYDGIQVNDTFYSLGYITGHETAFGDIFGPANPNNVILDFNKKAAKFSNYLSANPADFDAWASNAANQTPANPTTLMKADGTCVPVTPPVTELTVKSATAVNGTTLNVIFSDDSTATITGLQLVAGTHDVSFTHAGKSYVAEDVTYTPPVLTVQEVKRDNYRHFQVIFNGMVNLESAEKAENYYFFINEGNSDYQSVLPASNQLDKIEGLKIEAANNAEGKTVVDIYLPEDNRFTNIADFLPQMTCAPLAEYLQQIPWYNNWYEIYGFDTQAWADDEQSILVNKANDVHGVNSNFWALTAGRNVDVAVRNIRDINGQRTIDTAVKAMEIKDDVRPVWTDVYQMKNDLDNEVPHPALNTAALPTVDVYADNSEKVRLEFNEPVFNTHGLGVADINNHGHYNVSVAVDDTTIASTNDQNLGGILNFYMGAEDSYQLSSCVDLDIKAAIERLYTDGFKAVNTYKISITGITDLAGNLTNPQVLEFNVSLRDRDGSDGIYIPAPEVKKVMQIHDNAFRVYINRPDVTGTFEIRNGDGEDGLIQYEIDDITPVKVKDQLVWYKDVYVPAVDMEKTMGVNIKDDQLLAYDRQETLKRTLRVFEVGCKRTPSLTGNTYERSFENRKEFTIKQDINAPVVVDPEMIKWTERKGTGHKITLDVKDVVPSTWATDADAAQPVYAMLYDYQFVEEYNNLPYGLFDFNAIDTSATEWYNMHDGTPWDNIVNYQFNFDLQPIIVSYTVGNIKHTAVVSNRCLLNEFANRPGESGRHYGAPGSIKYNFNDQQLVLDLSNYEDLLNSDGELVQGVEYSIEIPGGYFADQARINAYNYNNGYDNGTVNTDNALWFVPTDDVLYVSDGRNNNSDECVLKGDANRAPNFGFAGNGSESYMVHGYTSAADVVTQAIGVEPVVPEEPQDAVPQTTKERINWFEDRNEIWVEFSGSIDPATLKNPANYMLNDVTLQSMGMTSNDIEFVVSSENPWNLDDRQFAEIKLPYDTINVDGDYSFKVSGVSNLAGGTMTPVEVRLDIDENFRPIIEKAVILGDHEIELTFNESVRYIADPAIDPENLAVAAKENFVVYVNDTAFTPQSATVGTTPLPNENPNPTYPLNKVVRLNVGSVDLLTSGLSISVEIVKNQNLKIMMEDKNCNPLNDEVDPFVVK